MSKWTQIIRDARNKILGLARVDGTGAIIDPDPDFGSVLLRLGQNGAAPYDGARGDALRIFGVHFTDTAGNKKWCSAVVSAPIDDTTSGPSDPDNTPSDLWIGGGGGNRAFQISSQQSDYYTGYLWNGTGFDTGNSVNVAKPPRLRCSVTSLNGVTYQYDTVSWTARTASWYVGGTQVNQSEIVSPVYVAGDILTVSAVDYTGVTVSGTPVKYIDLNIDSRRWLRKYYQ